MINIDLTKKDGVNIDFTANVVYGEGEGGKTVDVVQSTGSSKNAVMSQDAVTKELEKKTDDDTVAVVAKTGNYSDLKNRPDVYTRTEVDNKIKDTKNYLDSEISKIDVPDVSKLATKAEMSMKADRGEIPTMTSQLRNNSGFITKNDIPTIPTALSQLEDDSNHRLVTDEEKQNWDNKSDFSGDYNDLDNKPTIPDVSRLATREEVETALNTKQDKTAIVTATDSVIAGNRSVIDVTGDAVISLEPYEEDGYAHSYEIVLNVGDTAYSVAFPESVKWVKNLEIEANTTYSIVIEDNLALYVAIK